jgi:copper chaperone CopZ
VRLVPLPLEQCAVSRCTPCLPRWWLRAFGQRRKTLRNTLKGWVDDAVVRGPGHRSAPARGNPVGGGIRRPRQSTGGGPGRRGRLKSLPMTRIPRSRPLLSLRRAGARRRHYRIVLRGQAEPACCLGCEAVAQTIIDSGNADYYRLRTDLPKTPEAALEELKNLQLYDLPEVQNSFVKSEGDTREASLILEGIVCAACVWLNERHLHQLPGVLAADINFSTRRARVRWDDSRIHLSDILKSISRHRLSRLPLRYQPAGGAVPQGTECRHPAPGHCRSGHDAGHDVRGADLPGQPGHHVDRTSRH